MSRIAYVNGRYLPHRRAAVHVEDRGYQFADGVYEVIAVRGGGLVDEEPHLDRLDRSLAELRIAPPMGRGALKVILREVMRRNLVRDGMIYLQVSRGVAPRDHSFPARARPALVVTARHKQPPAGAAVEQGVGVVTVEDIRWKRCDIKSVSLLPNVLAKQDALDAGAFDAWMVGADGRITEGSASNAWIITKGREVITRPPSQEILDGVTRRAVKALARQEGLSYVERAFSVAEAKSATEAFLTSTSARILPVTRIDDVRLGDGKPGPLTRKLLRLYADYERRAERAAAE
ncbi:MAG: D-amino-acid transaminase [Alphaproteobacteria bacterium]|nr:D-amino-acid transaminase [Alphaproteobacteria bacterium]